MYKSATTPTLTSRLLIEDCCQHNRNLFQISQLLILESWPLLFLHHFVFCWQPLSSFQHTHIGHLQQSPRNVLESHVGSSRGSCNRKTISASKLTASMTISINFQPVKFASGVPCLGYKPQERQSFVVVLFVFGLFLSGSTHQNSSRTQLRLKQKTETMIRTRTKMKMKEG